MKPTRWSSHAEKEFRRREIDRAEADKAVTAPDSVVPGTGGRKIHMRVYYDAPLNQRMLLRVVVEQTADELAVVTVYKTSKIEKYLGGAK